MADETETPIGDGEVVQNEIEDFGPDMDDCDYFFPDDPEACRDGTCNCGMH